MKHPILARTDEGIERRMIFLRGQRVTLDYDLALMYGVKTGALNRAVKRNRQRFPGDFMLLLTRKEVINLRCQSGISSSEYGGRRYLPRAFTEQGVAMLSSVLNSQRAIQVNIAIMRAFVRLRELLGTHKDLARKLEQLELKYDAQFKVVFDAIRELMKPPERPSRRIGFAPGDHDARKDAGSVGRHRPGRAVTKKGSV